MDIEYLAEKSLDELVEHLGGQRRDPQVRLARNMARHQENGIPVLVQAPTGIGKSFAAIAAARASNLITLNAAAIEEAHTTGAKTLISTHTQALQQQLQRDAQMLSEATGGFSVAVLKGRSSYFCKLRGKQIEDDQAFMKQNGEDVDPESEISKILDWESETITGEKSELDFSVSREAWGSVSVSSDQCAGSGCPFYKQCWAEQAKQQAKEADITILNHALVAQGMRQETFLDDAFSHIILDECHEFASVVGEAFGATVTNTKLKWAASQARRVATTKQLEDYDKAVDALVSMGKGVKEPLRHLNGHKALMHVRTLIGNLTHWIIGLENKKTDKSYILKQTLSNLMHDLEVIAKGDTKTQTAWIEWREDNFTLRSVMFNVGTVIKNELLDRYKSTIFLSATIKTGKSFKPTAARLGLTKTEEWEAAEIPHLFDYQNNGMIWLPERMKAPNHPDYLSQVSQVSKAAIKAANGRTLILCTSWKGVDTIGNNLREWFDKEDIPVIIQRPGVNLKVMAEEFKANPHSVLIGTRTLWTGMSFEGDTCACVIIDKVPFPSPGDPIIAARCEDAEDNDISSFGTIMVPEASLTITQGAGRLIRTPFDQGVLVLPDPRLNNRSQHYKNYGKRILDSLPPMPIEHDTKVALQKLHSIHESATKG